MTATALAATIDALVAMWRATLPDELVLDGLEPGDDTTSRYLVVGVEDPWDREQSTDAATSDQSFPLLGGRVRDERLVVRCVVIAWSGDMDLKACRTAATSLLDDAVAALTQDPSLGGAVLHTTALSGFALRQSYASDGVVVNVPFQIECQARLT